MSKTIEVYTLEELRTVNPEAFEKVHEEWAANVDSPWSDEVMDSLKAVISAFGATLNDWSIGAHSQGSFISVSVDDEWEETFTDDDGDDDYRTHQKDLTWAIENVIKPLGYPISNVGRVYPQFLGDCKLTGYCADDDFLEAVCKSLDSGETLTDALQSLADDARIMMENDLEQQQEEESMLANWGDCLFTFDGVRV